MKTGLAAILVAAVIILLSAAAPAAAHRLDEYLQATTVAVAKDRIALEIRLTPGVQVLRPVLAAIDTDGDGVISKAEERAYGERVLHDLSFTMDGHLLPIRLVSSRFPAIEEMTEGLGEIQLGLEARISKGGPDRKLIFENHHQSGISVYLVNCLAPSDPDIRVVAQHRNYEQSFYQLDYTEGGIHRGALPSGSWSTLRGWFIADGLVLLASVPFLWRRRRGRGTNVCRAT